MFNGHVFSAPVTALLFAVGLTACGASAAFEPTAAPPHATSARSPESVALLNAPPPADVAVEIGRLEAASGTHAPTGDGKPEALAQLRKVAGENGCDAIVISEPEEDLFATSNGTPLYKTHQHAICFVNR